LKVGKVDPGRLDQRVRELVDGDEIPERVVGAILSVRRELLESLQKVPPIGDESWQVLLLSETLMPGKC
jgi:hypothetical protein